MSQVPGAAAKGLHMAFARTDLERSVVESSLVSLNEYTFHCLATSFTAIAMIAHRSIARGRETETVEFPALAPLML